MKNIKILKEAELELWATVLFYEEKRKGLGLDFEIEIRKLFLGTPCSSSGEKKC